MDEHVLTIRFVTAETALDLKKQLEKEGYKCHVYDYEGNESWMDGLKEVTD